MNKLSSQVLTKLWDRPRITEDKRKQPLTEEHKQKIRLANLGKRRTEETKQKISNARKGKPTFTGKQHTPKTKQKMRLSRLGKYHSEETKQKISINHAKYNLGKHHSEETKLKLSLANLGKHHSEETKQKISINHAKHNLGKHHSEETKQKMKEARSKLILPTKDSKPEKMMQIALALEGIKFEKHKSIKINNRYYQPDIFIKPNIIILIHGCYFHYCKLCFKDKLPTITQKNNIKRDKKTIQILNSNGYNVNIIWEHQIRDNRKFIFKAQNYINLIKNIIETSESNE